jgi:hypothetical protein
MNQVERDRAERVMAEAKRQIWVTWQREGIHKYPAALTDPNLADVEFLGYPHRHIFHFRVWIDVFHNDRDLEFIQFKRWCESLYSSDNSVLSLDHKSCEMIADDLYIQIATRYPGRVVHIEVSEDGENGALIRYELTKPNLNIVI